MSFGPLLICNSVPYFIELFFPSFELESSKNARLNAERKLSTVSVSLRLCLIVLLTYLLRVSYFSFNLFSIRFSRQNPFELIIALSSSGEAQGVLFYDDGESLGKQKR